MILASTLTLIMMPTWMAEQTLNGKNNITQTCQVTKLSMMVYKEKSSSHRERTLFGDLQGADVDGGFNFIENKISTDANKQTLRSFNDGKITYKWDNYIGSASVFATMDYNAYGHYPSDPERPVRYIIRIDHSIETKKIGDANNLIKNFEAKIHRYKQDKEMTNGHASRSNWNHDR